MFFKRKNIEVGQEDSTLQIVLYKDKSNAIEVKLVKKDEGIHSISETYIRLKITIYNDQPLVEIMGSDLDLSYIKSVGKTDSLMSIGRGLFTNYLVLMNRCNHKCYPIYDTDNVSLKGIEFKTINRTTNDSIMIDLEDHVIHITEVGVCYSYQGKEKSKISF